MAFRIESFVVLSAAQSISLPTTRLVVSVRFLLLQRADEIQGLNPKVAYYCRLHAIEQVHSLLVASNKYRHSCSLKPTLLPLKTRSAPCLGFVKTFFSSKSMRQKAQIPVKFSLQGLQLPERTPEIQGVLELLMEKLEQDKPSIAASDDDAAVCEAFAIKVFKMADTQDREGKANAKTVKAFYAASIFIDVSDSLRTCRDCTRSSKLLPKLQHLLILRVTTYCRICVFTVKRHDLPDVRESIFPVFFQVLEHFGELPPDMVERKQYAFWKAADIRKALREGRRPDPGPPVKDDLDLDLPDIPSKSTAPLVHNFAD